MAINSFQTLRSFVRQLERTEQCNICGAGVEDDHEHLIEPLTRKLACVCNACAMLFAAAGAPYKRIPREIRLLDGLRITDAQWDVLRVPANPAFFFKSSAANKMVALYPSPAGPIESLLSLDTWDEIARANPAVKTMKSDVEALLVRRDSGHYYLLPIDRCFGLVGIVRTHWRGLSGGSDVWERIEQFFTGLQRAHA